MMIYLSIYLLSTSTKLDPGTFHLRGRKPLCVVHVQQKYMRTEIAEVKQSFVVVVLRFLYGHNYFRCLGFFEPIERE